MGATPREFESRILRHRSPRRPEVAITDSDPPRGHPAGGRVGPALLAVAAGCLATTGLLGPSAAQAPLGRGDNGATPPWHVTVAPSPWVVTGLMTAAVVAGTAVVALLLAGWWRPRPARLAAAGALVAAALALLPPIGSADLLSYAAYGRMAVTGHDPYTTTPAQRAAAGDPVAAAVEVPWRHTPSVYGPLATAEQASASAVGGRDVALTVVLLDAVNAVAFLVAGWVLLRLAATEAAKLRAAGLWLANPLLWLQLVAGAHLDAVAAVAAISAVAVAERSRAGAGALAGAAAAVKAPAGLVWVATAWAWRRSPRAVVALTAGALAVAVPGYVVAGSGAFRQLSRASRLVSLATPWRPVLDATGSPRRLIGALATVLFLLLVAALLRRRPAGAPAVVVAAAIALAYVLAAPYALPWYDALPWAFVAALAASWLDVVLLAHTAVLSLAYIPGRAAAPLHGLVHTLTWGMRTDAAPVLLTVLLVVVATYSLRDRRLRSAAPNATR